LSYDEIKKLSFTGSVRVGKILKSKIGLRKLTLELGSTAGLYVSKNIKKEKIDGIADQIVNGAFSYNGQVCISTQKVSIDDDIYHVIIEKIDERTESFTYDELHDEKTDSSHLIDSTSQKHIISWINQAEKAGASILTGGKKNSGGISP